MQHFTFVTKVERHIIASIHIKSISCTMTSTQKEINWLAKRITHKTRAAIAGQCSYISISFVT